MCHKLARQLVDEYGFNQRNLAVKVKLPRGYLTDWLNGKRILQPNEVERIRAYFAELNLV